MVACENIKVIKKAARFRAAFFKNNKVVSYLVFFAKSAPALNFTTFLAGILISLPF
jgi:phosphoenolpyruvate carboxylase